MLELLLLSGFGFLVFKSARLQDQELIPLPRKISDRLGGLWDIAHQGMRENRFLRAEKALLTILKIDQKNAAAYNRLGILYAKQKEFKDAIDCFEIASSIDPTASSYHNLGLIYFETENYPKAAIAFDEALKLEDTLAARHIAYAKVQEKLGNNQVMLEALKKAIELEANVESLTLIQKAYEGLEMQAELDDVTEKLRKLAAQTPKEIKTKKVLRPRRVVV